MRYLISGYYGEQNAGDEAILAGILQEIRRRDADAEFVVLSFDPEDTRRRHHVDALSTSLRDPAALAAAMRAAHLLISGGGSILHEADFDAYGRSFLFRQGKLRPVPYFLSVVLMARALGLPVMWYAQGLGPLHTRTARRLVGLAGSASRLVSWRDPESARLAAEVGVRAPVQVVVPDPAYALEPASLSAAAAALEAAGLPPGSQHYLAVCPRPWLGRSAYLRSLTAAVGAVAAERDLAIVLVPFHARLDAPLCAELAASPEFAGRAHVVSDSEPALLAAILGRAECAVTMRLHSGILSAAAGTPAVALDYDPKVAAFAAQTGQERWAVTLEVLESNRGSAALETALRDTLDHLHERRAALERRVAPLRREAGRTAALAVQLAAGGRLRPGGGLA
ncbi:MAG: polysaccharide pyruvyl transferase CsaB [Thermoleophilia bacterium]